MGLNTIQVHCSAFCIFLLIRTMGFKMALKLFRFSQNHATKPVICQYPSSVLGHYLCPKKVTHYCILGRHIPRSRGNTTCFSMRAEASSHGLKCTYTPWHQRPSAHTLYRLTNLFEMLQVFSTLFQLHPHQVLRLVPERFCLCACSGLPCTQIHVL